MKFTLAKIGLFLFALVLFNTAQAKIWRLNNNGNSPVPAIVADFTGTLQAAHDNPSVVSGDTLHIEQSPTSYGNCIFSKRLVIIGSGYFLNMNPKTQVNVDYGSTVGDLTFYNINSASTHVFGLSIGNIYMGANNLLISRCKLSGLVVLGNTNANNIDGMTIRQCFINGTTVNGQAVIRSNSGTGVITNMDISNNIIATGGYTYSMGLGALISGILKNNVINSYYGNYLQNFYVVNNIATSAANYGNTFSNSTIEFNVGTVASMFVSPAGTNNIVGTGNQTFTAAQIKFLLGTSSDNYYSLAVGSECIGIGKSGTDCGAFGGDYPYKLSGIAPVPNIYKVVIDPIAAGASNIQVTVSAKGNN